MIGVNVDVWPNNNITMYLCTGTAVTEILKSNRIWTYMHEGLRPQAAINKGLGLTPKFEEYQF